nr:hypothetical protein [Pandoravirus massiliensis]
MEQTKASAASPQKEKREKKRKGARGCRPSWWSCVRCGPTLFSAERRSFFLSRGPPVGVDAARVHLVDLNRSDGFFFRVFSVSPFFGTLTVLSAPCVWVFHFLFLLFLS